ncbi:MAG: ribonuclease Z [Faecalibacterium sp.]|jgi:ribonuclease Z|nr:ribonuclease Z [Faecalibacterium sp.]
MVDVTLLGCGGTMPLPGRALSALSVRCGGRSILVDCGEGTQAAARAAGVSLAKTDVICLTHFHGDHIFGLPGMLQTIANQGRTEPILLVGPAGLKKMAGLLLALAGPMPFAVHGLEITENTKTLPGPGGLAITAFAADHRVPCLGYAFSLPRAGRFLPEKAKAAGVPQRAWKRLQQGESVSCGGREIRPEIVLGPAREGIKLVYCTDTRPCLSLERAAAGAELLILDGTYATDAEADKAQQYGHSTFGQAAALAAKAGAKRLWLTHFGGALENPAAALPAAQAIFAAAEAGADGKQITLTFPPERDLCGAERF